MILKLAVRRMMKVSDSILSSVMVGGGRAIATPANPNNGPAHFRPTEKFTCDRNWPSM